MVEIVESPSIFFAGMAGSRIPIVTAHGEGQPNRADPSIVCMRYVDNRGQPTDDYPYNPSGAPGGITGLTTPDGRFTIVMPHPERVFRNVQMSWRRRARRKIRPGCSSSTTRGVGSAEQPSKGAAWRF